MSEKIVVVAAKRTPFGAFGGTLKDITATDLAVHAAKATLEQANVKSGDVDHVVLGSVVQATADSIYTPRHVGLKTGVPIHVGALGVNRLCGSGFQSWVTSLQMILTGEANVVLAGGTEQMSLIPYVARSARWGMRMGHVELEDYLTAALVDQYAGAPMAITAENLAVQYKLSREEVDAVALRSQARYKQAFEKGVFKSEIAPIKIASKKGEIILEADEHARPDTTIEKLAKLPPLFKKDGVVTAGNSSGIVDGAAMSLLMTESEAKKRGLKPLAKIVSYASVGCEPKIMGIGPVYAIKNALQKANLKLDQMDAIEVNEAFCAQYLSVERELQLPQDRTNCNGGATAIGHPLGASGTRIMNHLIYELERRNGKYAVGSACIGGGQGIAIVIEKA